MFSLTEAAPASAPTRSMDLKVRDVRAGYLSAFFGRAGLHLVVDGLSFDAPAGSVTALVGSNGAGKSTILKAIVDSRFRLGGTVLSGAQHLETGQVGYLPQQSVLTLFPWRTGLQNAALWKEIHKYDRERREGDILRVCEEFELKVPLDRVVSDLSGGERVKVALIRSLAVDNMRAWVLDEPFEGLDLGSRLLLRTLIKKVAAKGVPVLLTSHRREDLAAVGAKEYLISGRPVSGLSASGSLLKSPEAENASQFPLPEKNERKITPPPTFAQRKEQAFPLGVVGVIAGLLIWTCASLLIGRPSLIPSPVAVAEQIVDLYLSPGLFKPLGATLSRAFGSLLIGAFLAIPFGVFIGYHSSLYKLIAPWLSVIRAFPLFALTSIAVGLFARMPETQRVFLVSLTIFVILLQIVSSAAFVAPRRRVDIARIYGAGELFCLSKVMFYESIGGILAGLETTLPLAVIVTIVVENFLIPNTGLGPYIYNNLAAEDKSLVWAYLLCPAILAATGVWLIRSYARKWRYEL
jgi:ABC-2 type transport system ATP-binding protein